MDGCTAFLVEGLRLWGGLLVSTQLRADGEAFISLRIPIEISPNLEGFSFPSCQQRLSRCGGLLGQDTVRLSRFSLDVDGATYVQ